MSTKPFYRTLSACILCRSPELDVAVPLERMPIATPNFAVPDHMRGREDAAATASLDLKLCRACGHLQAADMIDPEFNYSNYVYKTSFSLGLVEHFRAHAEQTMARYRPAQGALVVDIGSNDGSLLRFFKDRGHRVLGVDPAQEIARQATANGIPTVARFFNRDVAAELAKEHGQAAIIMANNVIANIEDVGTFTGGLDPLLAPDGVFIFETQYGADVIDKMLLDTVYNEHLSYFMIRPLAMHYDRLGYEVIAVDRIPTKGGSIRVAVQRKGAKRPVSPEVGAIIADEERRGMFGLDYYRSFSRRVKDIAARLNAIIDEEEKKGRVVAGYGVSVGTTTLLHQFGLTRRIPYLFDDNPVRESHMRGPGYAIPVFAGSTLPEKNPSVVIVFAWRYIDAIAAKQQGWLAKGGRFVLPVPEVSERTA